MTCWWGTWAAGTKEQESKLPGELAALASLLGLEVSHGEREREGGSEAGEIATLFQQECAPPLPHPHLATAAGQ